MAREFLLSVLTAGAMSLAPNVHAQDLVKRGEYLATIIGCHDCHTNGGWAGNPDPNMVLAGSDSGFEVPGRGGVVYPPNLTPDVETGLGRWSNDDLAKAIRTGTRPDGSTLLPPMPYVNYANLTDDDTAALVAFLKSLKPVHHVVPKNVNAGETPVAPYLGFVVPKK